MSGQSITDRVMAAKHSIAGQGLAKSVCKSTTEEVSGPKKKHLDYLLQCTNEPNVSIPQLANLLIERTQSQNWVVVFKALVTIHNLMNYGNERFTQYLASNNCSFNLQSFLDKAGVQGYDMSTFIRRYSKYINEKAVSYRVMAFDFCKIKRGKEDGVMRTMSAEKLLKAVPILQVQLDALLEFDVTPNELTNGVINAAFMLLFKDLIRLFACYNDGIINLLEKYFEMNKKNCRDALDIYKRFLVRMDRVSEVLKVAESVGIDKGDIPDLAKAPSSLLEALEEHLKSLESSKKSGRTPQVTSAINQLAASANANAAIAAAAQISEDEKRKILEEENKHLQQLKEKKAQDGGSPPGGPNPFAAAAAATPANNASPAVTKQESLDLFSGIGVSSPHNAQNNMRPSDDLLGLAGPNPFAGAQPTVPQAAPAQSNNPFASSMGGGAFVSSPYSSPAMTGAYTQSSTSGFTSDAQFAAVFGNTNGSVTGGAMVTSTTAPPQGFDGFGELLQPASLQPMAQPVMSKDDKVMKSDLDSSLASLAGNLGINGPGYQKKPGHQWTAGSSERKLTGGANFMGPGMSAATFTPGAPQQPMMPAAGMAGVPPQHAGGGYQQPGMGGGMMPQPMFGSQPVGGQQQMGFGQPRPQMAQPNDPFGAL